MKVPKYIIDKLKQNQKLSIRCMKLQKDIDNWLEDNVAVIDLESDTVAYYKNVTDNFTYEPLLKALENDEEITDDYWRTNTY